ncbi:MAG: SRPBCC family protein [Promethearchaeota archaeon]|nr:MAG: SRPBCC family protein [Candidatus Lokiarchaeota archaeon]
MKTLTDSIEINAPPEKVYEWFTKFDENYLEWHPDHVKAIWLTEKKMEIGAKLYCEEYIHNELHKIKFKCSKIEPNKIIEFKNLFPISLICPKGSFMFESRGNKCLFTATLSFRMGNLLSKIAKEQVEAFKEHMKEEGENLKKIIEKP